MSTPESKTTNFVVPKTYYVYTYAHPDGTIFYIGKGTEGRIDHHEQEAGRSECPCKRCQVIRQVWASGKPVQKRIVYETFDEIEAFTYEHDLIEQHAGTALTNIAGNPVQGNTPVSFNPQKPRQNPPLDINRLSLEAELEKDVVGMRGAKYLLGMMTPITVLRLVQAGELDGFKVGDVWRFYRSDIEAYIRRQKERAKQPHEQEEE